MTCGGSLAPSDADFEVPVERGTTAADDAGDVGDGGAAGVVEVAGCFGFGGGEGGFPSANAAACSRCGQAGVCALFDEITENSARAANTWNTRRPPGVVVSIASWTDLKPTPRSASERTVSIKWGSDLPRRSNLQTTRVSPSLT